MLLRGRIESGRGEARRFTGLSWVTTGIEREAGFRPYPGTLNVRVGAEDRAAVERLFATPDFQLLPADSRYCSAVLKKVWIGGLPAVAVLPAEEVRVHGTDVVELIADRNLRQALMLEEGDEVAISDLPQTGRTAPRSLPDVEETRLSLPYPRAVVLDVDGTLVDSLTLYYEGFERLAGSVGVSVRRDEVLESLSVGTFRLEQIFPSGEPERERDLGRLRELLPGLQEEVIARARLFPWVPDVLAELARIGLRLGVVTSSTGTALAPLRACGLIHLFTAIVVREDGLPIKPAPDGVLACLKCLDTEPSDAWVVGDSPLDVRAGKAAGAWTVAVLTGIGSRGVLEAEKPDAILTSVADLPALLRNRHVPD